MVIKNKSNDINDFSNSEAFILNFKGVNELNFGNYMKALKLFDKALKINPNLKEILVNKVTVLMILDKKKEALECSDQILKIYPKDYDVLNNKARLFLLLGKYQSSIECIDELLIINPYNQSLYFYKAMALVFLNKDKEALELLEKYRKLRNSNEKGFKKSIEYKKSTEHQLLEIEKNLKNKPRDVDILIQKGVSLLNLEKYSEANILFNKLIIKEPNNKSPLFFNSVSLFFLGKIKESFEFFKRSL